MPLSINVTPVGSAPLFVRAGVGDPVVVTVNDPAVPTVNVVLLELVIVSAVPALTVIVWHPESDFFQLVPEPPP